VSAIRVGQLIVDRDRFAVTLAGQKLSVTRVEFDILEYLMQNANRVVSDAELSQHIIHSPHRPESSLLRVHMWRLRRKLGTASQALMTVRGRGHRFDEQRLTTDVQQGPAIVEA
jgi:DNA-binding response OmpR family regulator